MCLDAGHSFVKDIILHMGSSTELKSSMFWRDVHKFSTHTTNLGKQRKDEIQDAYTATTITNQPHFLCLLLCLDTG